MREVSQVSGTLYQTGWDKKGGKKPQMDRGERQQDVEITGVTTTEDEGKQKFELSHCYVAIQGDTCYRLLCQSPSTDS